MLCLSWCYLLLYKIQTYNNSSQVFFPRLSEECVYFSFFVVVVHLSLLLSSYWSLYHQLCPTFHEVMQNHQATCLYHCLPPSEQCIYLTPMALSVFREGRSKQQCRLPSLGVWNWTQASASHKVHITFRVSARFLHPAFSRVAFVFILCLHFSTQLPNFIFQGPFQSLAFCEITSFLMSWWGFCMRNS